MERGVIEATVRTAFDELVQARKAQPSIWLAGTSLAYDHRGGGPSKAIVNVSVHVDRDRCTNDQAHGFARELEISVSGGLANEQNVLVHITPTTRIEHVFALVSAHVESYSAQRAEETLRSGERWVWCATPERIVGWSHGEDRIRLEMVAESSADERAAAELGQRFLEDLRLEPELRALVDVVGTSH
jgi:hypothetical protein